MLELYNTDVCLAEDSLGLLNTNFHDLDESVLNQCTPTDEVRNKEISKALDEIGSGAQFAFYNLGLEARDQQLLSNIGISQFNNEVILWPKINHSELVDILTAMLDLSNVEVSTLARVIAIITEDIVSYVGATEAEVIIRTREPYESNGCSYWHIDKNRNQSLKDISSTNLDMQSYGDKAFLVVLKGESTNYQKLEKQERQLFHKYANETSFYYGHTATECREDDKITNMFKGENTIAVKQGYGSVHKVGKEGSIHKEPSESLLGRILLVITPIYKK